MARPIVTSTDVAQLAGVSQSAVSRVFTPGASVSKKMALKVREAAQKLGYRPNVLARSLITGQSKIIGLVVAYLDNQFYPDALERLSNTLQARGYHVLIFMADKGNANVQAVLEEILDYQVDGIILASVSISSALAERCDKAGVPVILFNRRQDDSRYSSVTSDNYTGGRRVAQFLVAAGHTRIAYIAGWEGASTQRDRERGFLSGLHELGATLFAREVGDFQFHQAQAAARTLCRQSPRPDAIFIANDHMAFAVIETLRYELGLQIPQDISIVGYDDVPLAAWPSYNLTTVRQPSERMVQSTVDTLLQRIDGRDTRAHHVVIESELIIRGSSKRPIE